MPCQRSRRAATGRRIPYLYSREFKLETLRLLKSSGKTKADLERELGLYPGQIHLWERAFNKEGGNVEQAFPGTWAL